MKPVLITLLCLMLSFPAYAGNVTQEHIKEQLDRLVQNEVQDAYALVKKDNISVQILNSDAFDYRLNNANSFKVSLIKSRHVLNRRVARVSLYGEDGHFLNYFSVFCNITVESDVFVFAKKLPKGTTIAEQDLELKTITVKNSRFNYAVLDTAHIIGRKTAYSIQPGDIVSKWTLVKESFLKKGKQVNAVYKNGTLEVGVKAVAIENGELGDEIRVRVKPHGKIVLAEIKGPNYVEIMSDM